MIMETRLFLTGHSHKNDESLIDRARVEAPNHIEKSNTVTDLRLRNGRYIIVEYSDDGDGPILDSE